MKVGKWFWVVVSLLFFGFGVFAVSARDYMVHGIHYSYGLYYSHGWADIDTYMYILETQFVALAAAVISRRVEMVFPYEAFVLSAGQDLVFFGFWHNLLRMAPHQPTVFPVGDWEWMAFYQWFGTWTTTIQFIFTIAATFAGVVLALLLASIRKQRNKSFNINGKKSFNEAIRMVEQLFPNSHGFSKRYVLNLLKETRDKKEVEAS